MSKKRKQQKNSGFTLVEVILYLALTATIVGLLGTITTHTLSGRAKSQTMEEVVYNGHFILSKLERIIESAEAINTPLPYATSSTLSLEMSESVKNPTVLNLNASTLYMTEGPNASSSLSTSGVEIADIIFSNISNGSSTGLIRIMLTINSKNINDRQDYDASETFYTTVSLYEQNG